MALPNLLTTFSGLRKGIFMRKALVVGINDYPKSPLRGCVNDANAIAGVLKKHGDGSPNFHIKPFTSPASTVTKAILKESIEQLFAGDSDIALFYFSGHGIVTSTGGYIVTPDYKKYDEGVSMDEILKLANASKAKDKVILLDCCYAGSMGSPAITGSSSALLSEGLTVLTACRDCETAFEKDGSGIFTSLVTEALQGGSADLRGEITPGSVYAYVDQALGAWDQRPIFKTNVTRFTSLRKIAPPVPLETLRKIAEYFPSAEYQYPLDPTYEFTEKKQNRRMLQFSKIYKNSKALA